MENNKQLGGVDFFKLFASFMVIAIHTSPMSSFNNRIDFLITGILARIAVPFFLMVTGYFLLPQYLFQHTKDFRPLLRFLKNTLLLYAAAITIYLPVNFYAGQLSDVSIFDFLRMLLFDGTFYYLWYLPASMLGVVLLILISRILSFQAIFVISLALYGFGLLGDSYFGLISNYNFLKRIYEGLFSVFTYTRNGIFYTPVFLVMGAGIKQQYKCRYLVDAIAGFIISVSLMIFEGFILEYLGVQHHNSMYILLLPVMFFLFQMILSNKVQSRKSIRAIATWIYIIHPLVIILVRGMAKATYTENYFINNSILHYFAVCLLSFFLAVILHKLLIKMHKEPFCTDRAWIEIDKDSLRKNVHTLERLLPQDCKIMAAVKANAYGHGAAFISKELNQLGIMSFCVATASEGIELRRKGIRGEILILGYTHPHYFPMLRKYCLTQTVIDCSYAHILNSYGKKVKVQIKIDTGMHRLGERAERIDKICEIFHCENLIIKGIFTHLCSDETKTYPDSKYTMEQATTFYEIVDVLKKRGYSCGKIHLLSSYGLINYPELTGNYARIGIALYGILSSRTDLESCPIKLHPVLSVKARVALTKDLYEGEAVGYGLQYVAESNRKIAVLSIGYADGFPRSLSCGHGKVLINGNEAPIVGRICMDQMLVDITNIPDVNSGDIAVIIGKSGQYEITAYDLAEASGTITNEILSRLSNRLSRLFI